VIFDLHDRPVSEDQYQQKLLASLIVVVSAVGGRGVCRRQMLEDLGMRHGKTYLEQYTDPATGDITLQVGSRP
jgi:hypothetical protein